LEELKDGYEKTLADIKYFYEMERNNLNAKIERMQAEVNMAKETSSQI
jgi:hypothetical protein